MDLVIQETLEEILICHVSNFTPLLLTIARFTLF